MEIRAGNALVEMVPTTMEGTRCRLRFIVSEYERGNHFLDQDTLLDAIVSTEQALAKIAAS